MEQYIDKSALAAKINERIRETESMNTNDPFWDGKISGLDAVLKIIDTLEVKEVDLEKELSNYIEHYRNRETGYTMFGIAKYFFELGLKYKK